MLVVTILITVHQRLSYLRSKRERVTAAMEALENAESTARMLQDSPFFTNPNYWRVYQLALVRRGAGVDGLWEDLES